MCGRLFIVKYSSRSLAHVTVILYLISDILSAAKANMLACNDGSGEDETADLVKSFLERSEVTHSNLFREFSGWVGKKILTGSFGPILCFVTCYPICHCMCPCVVEVTA